jgi:hypothetical protein
MEPPPNPGPFVSWALQIDFLAVRFWEELIAVRHELAFTRRP